MTVIQNLLLCILLSGLASFAQDNLELPAYSDSAAIIRHTGFTLEYAEKYEQAKWVAYVLTKREVQSNIAPRTDNFRPDPDVITGSATLADYKNSGFDRGHLYPAGDAGWDSTSMSDCFYLSNMSPQTHDFNAGIWTTLEDAVRDWAYDFDSLYVVTAGILTDGLPVIGTDSVAIPEYYYKALLKRSGTDFDGIGFLLKGENSAQPLHAFAITIDSLEAISGIDFFPKLEDTVEESVESTLNLSVWFDLTNNRIVKRPSLAIPLGNPFRMYDLSGRAYNGILYNSSSQFTINCTTQGTSLRQSFRK